MELNREDEITRLVLKLRNNIREYRREITESGLEVDNEKKARYEAYLNDIIEKADKIKKEKMKSIYDILSMPGDKESILEMAKLRLRELNPGVVKFSFRMMDCAKSAKKEANMIIREQLRGSYDAIHNFLVKLQEHRELTEEVKCEGLRIFNQLILPCYTRDDHAFVASILEKHFKENFGAELLEEFFSSVPQTSMPNVMEVIKKFITMLCGHQIIKPYRPFDGICIETTNELSTILNHLLVFFSNELYVRTRKVVEEVVDVIKNDIRTLERIITEDDGIYRKIDEMKESKRDVEEYFENPLVKMVRPVFKRECEVYDGEPPMKKLKVRG